MAPNPAKKHAHMQNQSNWVYNFISISCNVFPWGYLCNCLLCPSETVCSISHSGSTSHSDQPHRPHTRRQPLPHRPHTHHQLLPHRPHPRHQPLPHRPHPRRQPLCPLLWHPRWRLPWHTTKKVIKNAAFSDFVDWLWSVYIPYPDVLFAPNVKSFLTMIASSVHSGHDPGGGYSRCHQTVVQAGNGKTQEAWRKILHCSLWQIMTQLHKNKPYTL